MKVVIIGGGASGMVCAISLARRGINVEILEKNNSVLKKLLVTGNGKCNYFNSDMNINHYHSNNIEFLNNIITDTNINNVHTFFNSIGVVPKIKNGYYYPYSNTSTTIKNLLLLECIKLNIKIIIDISVLDIAKEDKFIIKTNQKNITCDKVIIATGSIASIKDEYNSYKILKKLGHTIIKPLPALTMLEGFDNYKDWAGIRLEACISLYENDKYLDKQLGELQLTNYGISGICVMNLSGRVNRILDNNKLAILKINFIPNIENGYKYLEERSSLLPNLNIIEVLESIINYKLLYFILKKCHINDKLKWNELNNKQKQLLIDNIFNFKFEVKKSKCFECAQVVSGGVSLDEITYNFESKLIKGLYIIGELLDVDGDCGGYNLGFAWISGMIVGDNL